MALSRPLMDDDHRALPLSTFSFSRRSIEYVMSFAFCLQLLGKGGRGGRGCITSSLFGHAGVKLNNRADSLHLINDGVNVKGTQFRMDVTK